jgi:hypothetical protein
MPPFAPKHREYRDALMRQFWESSDVGTYTRVRGRPWLAIHDLFGAIEGIVGMRAGLPLAFFFVCAMPLVGGIPRLRLGLSVLILSLSALIVNKYDNFDQVHYLAPALGAFFVVALFGLRLLRCHRLRKQRPGRALVASLVALSAVLFFLDSLQKIHNHHSHDGTDTTALGFRRQVAARLGSEPGQDLVLVRYAADHVAHYEIIYNSPDIDAQKIVWAFDFGPDADRPLLDYYRGRKVWLVQPDGPLPTLKLYSGN